MPELSEKVYLEELIQDFHTNKKIDIEAIWQGIQIRYRALDVNRENFIEIVLSENRQFKNIFSELAKSIHKFMFDEILSNAGEFRKASDPDRGNVKYGPLDMRSPWGTKFKGARPEEIASELKKTCALLSKNDSDPIRTSILFYQQFVHIHPFYDANGRVARFLVTLYLSYHGFYILWKQLEESKKNEFLKKLNACHLREGKHSFNEYFNYLHAFWKKYIISKDTLMKLVE